jgi:hypothetical protein
MASEFFKKKTTLVQNVEHDGLVLTFSAGAALKAGQEVRISGNNTVNTRTGTQYPIGVVIADAANSENVAVRVNLAQDLAAIAKGGTINAGAFVKPNGSFNGDGTPQYVAATTGDYALGIVISGGAVDTVIRVGILKAPVVVG